MVFLSIPTTAILASNNAVPGDKMYPVKTTIEKIASKLSSPSYQAHSDLEIQLIQRRIEENQKLLLAKGSTEGLKLLIAQAEAATEYILKSNVKSKIKTQTIQKLITTLQETQQILEQEKENLASNNTNSHNETSNLTISQGNSPPSETNNTQANNGQYDIDDQDVNDTLYEEDFDDAQEKLADMEDQAEKAKNDSNYSDWCYCGGHDDICAGKTGKVTCEKSGCKATYEICEGSNNGSSDSADASSDADESSGDVNDSSDDIGESSNNTADLQEDVENYANLDLTDEELGTESDYDYASEPDSSSDPGVI